jgi:hypothetical protein
VVLSVAGHVQQHTIACWCLQQQLLLLFIHFIHLYTYVQKCIATDSVEEPIATAGITTPTLGMLALPN